MTVVWLIFAPRATSRIGRPLIALARRRQNWRAYSASIGPRTPPVGQSPLMRYSAGGRSPRCLGLMAANLSGHDAISATDLTFGLFIDHYLVYEQTDLRRAR